MLTTPITETAEYHMITARPEGVVTKAGVPLINLVVRGFMLISKGAPINKNTAFNVAHSSVRPSFFPFTSFFNFGTLTFKKTNGFGECNLKVSYYPLENPRTIAFLKSLYSNERFGKKTVW